MAGADGNAETVSRQWVTAGIFDVLGVKPIAGRTFSADDESKRANVVVMSEGVLARAIQRRSERRSAARSVSTDRCGRWSASCRKTFSCWDRPACGRCGRSSTFRRGRAAPTCCRWSDA